MADNKAVETTNMHNTLRIPHTVMAEDGDTIFLPPGAHDIHRKFSWNPPEGVKTARDPVHSVHSAPAPAAAPVPAAPPKQDK